MSGDQVEIITSDIAKPEKEWLSFVRTSKAKEAIKNALKDRINKTASRKAWKYLNQNLRKSVSTSNADVLKKLILSYDVLNKDELYSGIGLGTIRPRKP